MKPGKHRWSRIHDELKAMMPAESFAALVARFGGKAIRIPDCVRESRDERRQRILDALKSETYDNAAESTGLSRATVYRESVR